jgi:ABC transporter family protein
MWHASVQACLLPCGPGARIGRVIIGAPDNSALHRCESQRFGAVRCRLGLIIRAAVQPGGALQSAPVLVIRSLGKRYRAGIGGCSADVRALEDVNLLIQSGEIVALVGAGGAGKTTLLRCAARLLAPDEGFVEHVRTGDGSGGSVRYFDDCIHAERAAAGGARWDLALIDDVHRIHGDVASAFALVRILARARRDDTAMLLAARHSRVVHQLADRTLHLEHGRLEGNHSIERPTPARVAEHVAPLTVIPAAPSIR